MPQIVGQEYRVGKIRVTGAKAFNEDTILSALGIVSGGSYDESQLRDGFRNLMRLYGSRGYVNFIPTPVPELDEQRKIVNLTVNIDEGLQFTVNRVGFVGNTTIPDDVLRREVLVKEGAVFDVSLLELSLSRLNQLRLFEEIRFEDARVRPLPDEAKVDVDLRVKEKTR